MLRCGNIFRLGISRPSRVCVYKSSNNFLSSVKIDHIVEKTVISNPPKLSKNQNAHNELVKTFQNIMGKKTTIDEKVDNVGSDLYKRQLFLEEEQHAEAIQEYLDSLASLVGMDRSTTTKNVQRIFLRWYEPLTELLQDECQAIRDDMKGLDRKHYGSFLLMLPIEKLAVITLNTAFNYILKSGNEGAKIGLLAVDIGDLLESEYNIQEAKKMLSRSALGDTTAPFWKKEAVKDRAYAGKHEAKRLNKKLRKINHDVEWELDSKVKLGSALLDILIKAAKKPDGTPAFEYSLIFNKGLKKKFGMLRLNQEVFEEVVKGGIPNSTPRLLPMLVPPRDWDNKMYSGAYLRLRTPLMKTMSQGQVDAVKQAEMDDVLVGLNYLGQTAWRINETVLDVIEEARKQNMMIGSIPNINDLPMPEEATCFRLPREIAQSRKPYKFRQVVEEVSDLIVPASSPEEVSSSAVVEEISKAVEVGEASAGKVAKKKDEEFDLLSDVPIFDDRLHAEMCRRVKQKNSEMHSLRCDLDIKLNVARKFRSDIMYFPHNLDFRGRAYPIPPNLSHLGNDLCRGLMLFHESRPLGKEGLRWLKIHLCNLFGNNKITMDSRLAWTESHMEDVLDSAAQPLDGKKWWTTAEDPFQALAACLEIKAALDSGDPENFQSRLPIHQDGSCNGLQHYAGLGRDSKGAEAVNLIPSSFPQDVYSKVLEQVLIQIEHDRHLPEEVDADPLVDPGKYARMVHGTINRKVIKQTVMTSVYGVTMTGARAQVQARLLERLKEDNMTVVITPDVEDELFHAARYVANLTLASLGKMFESARSIMDWLGECCAIVASTGQTMAWVTPLGLPVVQPYRKTAAHAVKTVLQTITLSSNHDHLPVSKQRQRSAFPPNFVHSLDATHMLMTCLKMKNEGKVFAAVHDSYWTHACDVGLMNELLRECFVHLYEYPVLDDLKDSLDMRFPDVEFPDIPPRGDLDIKVVKNSRYFFH